MRNYEAMFIFKPGVPEDILDTEIKHIEKTIKTKGKGSVKHENLGKKMMAYPVAKVNEGIYVNYIFSAKPESITKIKGSLLHDENIVRFIIFMKDEKK